MNTPNVQGSKLAKLQRWMQTVITHPAGVAAGVDSSGARTELDVAATDVERVVRRSNALTALERLQVYGDAYFARLLECLEAEFPAVRHAIGEEVFTTFACGYLHAHPSRSYTLNELGRLFPAYLREVRPARPPQPPLPKGGNPGIPPPDFADFVIELAELERLYSEVFDGPGSENGPVLTVDDLLQMAPDDWPRARLRCVPCLHLREFHFPVHTYATAVRIRRNEEARGDRPDTGDESPQHAGFSTRDSRPSSTAISPPAPQATHLVVTRRHYVVRRFAAAPDEFAVLRMLHSGATVGEAVRAGYDAAEGGADDFAQKLQAWFRQWAAAQLFSAVEIPE
jgi:hypothetical protein